MSVFKMSTKERYIIYIREMSVMEKEMFLSDDDDGFLYQKQRVVVAKKTDVYIRERCLHQKKIYVFQKDVYNKMKQMSVL